MTRKTAPSLHLWNRIEIVRYRGASSHSYFSNLLVSAFTAKYFDFNFWALICLAHTIYRLYVVCAGLGEWNTMYYLFVHATCKLRKADKPDSVSLKNQSIILQNSFVSAGRKCVNDARGIINEWSACLITLSTKQQNIVANSKNCTCF